MKSGFWKTEWFFGLVAVLVMLLMSNRDLRQSLERKTYDMGGAFSSRVPPGYIARLTDGSKSETEMVLGPSSGFASEQLAGRKIDGRFDLFSLPVSLYQMLCGKLLFEGESMVQWIYRIADKWPAVVSINNRKVPPSIAAFLDRAMNKDPDVRLQNGVELAALRRVAEGAEIYTMDSAVGGVGILL